MVRNRIAGWGLLVAVLLLIVGLLALAWQRGGPQTMRQIEQPVVLKEGKSA